MTAAVDDVSNGQLPTLWQALAILALSALGWAVVLGVVAAIRAGVGW